MKQIIMTLDTETADLTGNVYDIAFVVHEKNGTILETYTCLLYTSPSPRDAHESRMPSSA